jgi:hypothetical protein
MIMSIPQTIATNGEWYVNNILERVWKEAVMAQLEVLSWHLPERVDRNQKNPWDSCYLSQYLNQASPTYKAEYYYFSQFAQ